MKTLPIKNYIHEEYPKGVITQWFGDNVAMYLKAMGIHGHNGIDIVAPYGTPMYAVDDGEIADVKNTPDGFGKHIRLLAVSGNDVVEWTYGHCSKIYVEAGQDVKAGDHIADMGNTGFVISGATPYWRYNPFAGTHLHLGKRNHRLDSQGWSYPQSKYRIRTLDYNNGLKGAVDFADELKALTIPKDKQQKIISLQKQLIQLLQHYYRLLLSQL